MKDTMFSKSYSVDYKGMQRIIMNNTILFQGNIFMFSSIYSGFFY